jgi:DNA-binding CsgD family transcriptional regulator
MGSSAQELLEQSRARWWQGDEATAVALMEQAHAAFRAEGDRLAAVRTALWLSEEFRTVHANQAASNGWLTRAQRLVGDPPALLEEGWLSIARAARAEDPEVKRTYAAKALAIAGEAGHQEMETYALGHLGLALVSLGEVRGGVNHLDEAMAGATTLPDPVVLGDTACLLMQAAELVGDLSRFQGWAPVIEDYLARHGHRSLMAACGTCCGEVFAAAGSWTEAEKELIAAVASLEQSGHRSRCAHPAAQLASLRNRQGRFEDAERLIDSYRSLPEATIPLAEIELARGNPAAAIQLLERRLWQIGDNNLRSVPLLALLAAARAAIGDSAGARELADRIARLGETSDLDRVRAEAALAHGRALLGDDPVVARQQFEKALGLYERAQLPLGAGVVHLELAKSANEAAIVAEEAKAALDIFESLGAARYADEATALLRSRGVRARIGPKGHGTLTRRESEVLALIAEGLSNADIAERLFISEKTAANHVSNLLLKLGVRSRTEAAALALRNREPI